MEPGVAYLGGLLWLPREKFDSRSLKTVLTFVGKKTSDVSKPPVIRAWADKPYHIGVPILFWGSIRSPEFRSLFRDMEIPLKDLRPKTWEQTDITSLINLDVIEGGDRQHRAVKILLKNEHGILVLGCGMGKTIIALHAAAQFKAPFIIVVDDAGGQMQWAAEARKHLVGKDGRPIRVGLVGGGKAEWDAPVVVALIETLYKKAATLPMEIRSRFAVSIWDECHMLGAPEFSKAAPLFLGRRWGLSATPKRADGLETMYYKHIGDPLMVDLYQKLKPIFYFYRVKHKINEDDPTFRAYVKPNKLMNVMNLFTYLAGIRERTDEIAGVISQGMQAGRKVLVLSRRLFILDELVKKFPGSAIVTGRVKGEARVRAFREHDLIFCQYRLGEKRMDKPDLDFVLLCEPVKRKEVLQQIAGREQRPKPGKPTPIFVVIEDNIGPCLGLCRAMKRLIKRWPAEEGGPYDWRYAE